MTGISRIAVFVVAVAAVVMVIGGFALAEGSSHVLSVTSDGCSSVAIGGDRPNVTPYFAPCSHMEAVRLSAQPAITQNDIHYEFVSWIIDGQDQPVEEADVTITMDADHAVVAVYEFPTLTVESLPVPGIMTYNGHLRTPYSMKCSGKRKLHVEDTVMVAGEYYRFVRWELDGVPALELDHSIWLSFEMDRDHVAVAIFEPCMSTLAVRSLPVSNVSVSGDLPGTTDYSATCRYGHSIALAAPPTVIDSDGEHPFIRWMIDDVEQPRGENAVQIAMNADAREAVAVYSDLHPVLIVNSAPSGFPIGGDKPGMATYSAVCQLGQTVTLSAPAEFTRSDGVTFAFNHWEQAEQPDRSTREIQVVMNETTAVTAQFVAQPFILTIRSEPFAGIKIGGYAGTGGTSDYEVAVSHGRKVTLTAWNSVDRDGTKYMFHRWLLDGVEQPGFQTELTFIMDTNRTCVAVYAQMARLDVVSSPSGVSIEGDKPGIARYKVAFFDPDTISLTAPLSLDLDDGVYEFLHWRINSVTQPEQQNAISVTMDGNRLVEAIYEKPPQVRVLSTPIQGVPVSGDKSGTTGYTAICRGMDFLDLQAPEICSVDGIEYRFAKWSDRFYPVSEPRVRVEVAPGAEATACYTDQPPTLTVSSSPANGVQIDGTTPGTTSYTVTGSHLEPVTLQAPPRMVWMGKTYEFAQWIVDGWGMPTRQMTLNLTMRGDRTARAVYAAARLRIQGPADRGEPPVPPGGGTFTVDLFLSDAGMFAGFTAALQFLDASGTDAAFPIAQGPGGNPACDDLKIVFNDARWPSIFPLFSGRRLFGFISMTPETPVVDETWLCTVTCEYGPSAEGTYSIAGYPNPDCTLVASDEAGIDHYELLGTVVIGLTADLNDDCTVNEADLLALRGMLGQRGSPGMRGDLNADGVIDTLDLIILRNKMGKTCTGNDE